MLILAYSIECLTNNVEGGWKMRIGIHRKVDNLGRVTIPKEFREFYHLNEQDSVCLIDTQDGLLITSPKYKVVEISTEEEFISNNDKK